MNLFSVEFCSNLTRHILLEKDKMAKNLAQPQMNKTNEYYIKHCQKREKTKVQTSENIL